mgnify:CR=1 FL=1
MSKIFKCQSCGTKYPVDDESEYDVSICKWCDQNYYFDENVLDPAKQRIKAEQAFNSKMKGGNNGKPT